MKGLGSAVSSRRTAISHQRTRDFWDTPRYLMQAYDETCRNIIFSDKSHHSSPRSFRATAGSTAFAAIPHSPESGSTGSVQCTAANVTFCYSQYLDQALLVLSVGWQTRVTSDKHVAHCSSKLYRLSVPAGISQRWLSDDIMPLFKLVVFRTAKDVILMNWNRKSRHLGSNLASGNHFSLCLTTQTN